MSTEITVVGAPVFANGVGELAFHAPVGEVSLYKAIRKRVASGEQLMLGMFHEYGAIIDGLRRMGENFSIIRACDEMVAPGIFDEIPKMGIDLVDFPAINPQNLIFPRDLATCLENHILIDSELYRSFTLPMSAYGKSLSFSPYGQGGRVVIGKRTACVVKDALPERSVRHMQTPLFMEAELRGYKTVYLPHSVMYREEHGLQGFVAEDHVDRTCGHLVGKDARTHIVMSREMRSGYRGFLREPGKGSRETMSEYESDCKNAGFELHVVDKLTIPASTCFLQLENGKVLMTKGDDAVAKVVETVVGTENVFYTKIPIEVYPAWVRSGIRCAVNKIPAWLPGVLQKAAGSALIEDAVRSVLK